MSRRHDDGKPHLYLVPLDPELQRRQLEYEAEVQLERGIIGATGCAEKAAEAAPYIGRIDFPIAFWLKRLKKAIRALEKALK
jgi:hypothetical protein